MIITRLGIDYFGKFNNKEIKLQEGINLIYGENEAGKSTIHTFIKGMLFGIDPLRGRAAKTSKDTYNRYLPWEYPGAYAGSMDIILKGKKYRLFRNFISSDKSFKIIDLDTGRELALGNGLISDLIPGLTESTYDNTINFRQSKSKTEDELASELQNHIANLSLAKSKEVNVDNALDSLNQQRRCYTKEIDTYESYIKDLEDQIQIGQNQLEEIEELNDQWLESNNRLEKLEEELLEISDNELVKLMDDLPLVLERYSTYKNLVRQSNQLESHIKEILALRDEISAYEDRLNKLKTDKGDLSRGQKGSKLIASITFIVINLIAFIFSDSCFFRLAVFIVMIFIYVFALLYTRKKKNNILSQQEAEIDDVGRYIQSYRSQLDRLNSLEEELDNTYDIRDPLHDQVMGYMQSFITEEELTDQAVSRLEEEIIRRESKISRQIEELEVKYEKEKRILEEINWRLKDLEDVEENLLKNEGDYQISQEKVREVKSELQAVTLAIDTIRDLSKDIHDSFGNELDLAVSGIIKRVTGGRYGDLKIDENLGVKVAIGSNYIPMDVLSGGTIEQMYFALRLAVADLLIDDKMPILLDDTFALYDDERIRTALKELIDLEQVIIFTCHKREEEILEEIGLSYKLIEL